ncbi:hypothetical protein SUGI_1122430 [Cryptomeria japonica]|nr:hypothetical protein SUGI_1122430 [Cryptomeria japonica]
MESQQTSVNRRRLLSDARQFDFVSWISGEDRRLLLQTAAGVTLTGNVLTVAKNGVYEEYVRVGIKKYNIMIIGDGKDATVITGYTINSATFATVGKCFNARDLTIGQKNTITAQGRTDPNQNTGTSIDACNVTAAPDLVPVISSFHTYLGRPWKKYSRAVYMQSYLRSLIDPAGWLAWKGSFALTTLYFGEYEYWGPGSNTSHRVKCPGYHVMNRTDALNFTVSNFISGDTWLPATSIPYDGRLY